MYLGGYVAEELIFGKENVTTGAVNDIRKATEMVLEMIKEQGMGSSLPVTTDLPHNASNHLFHEYHTVEKEAMEIISMAKQLAADTLQKEIVLLTEMADYLSDNRHLKKEEIRDFIQSYAVSKIDIIETGSHLFYRNRLKKLVKESKPNGQKPYQHADVLLNYQKKHHGNENP